MALIAVLTMLGSMTLVAVSPAAAQPGAVTNTTNPENPENYDSLGEAVAAASDGDTLVLNGDQVIAEQVTITTPVDIDGGGFTITTDFDKTDLDNNSAIGVYETEGVAIHDVTIVNNRDAATSQLHGVNLWEATGVTLTDISVSGFRSGVLVNSSIAEIDTIATSGNIWHAIDVEQATSLEAELTISGHNIHLENSPATAADFVDGVSVPHLFTGDDSQLVDVIDVNDQYATFEVPFRTDMARVGTLASGTVTNTTLEEDYDSLAAAIADANDGDNLQLTSDQVLAGQVTITAPVTIDGDGFTITTKFNKSAPESNSAIGVFSTDGVAIHDVTIVNDRDAAASELHGVNLWEATGVTLTDISVFGFRSGVLVNSSIAEIDTIATGGNIWHAIDVEQATSLAAELTIDGTSVHFEDSPATAADFVDGVSVPHLFTGDVTQNLVIIDVNDQYNVFNVDFRSGDARVGTLKPVPPFDDVPVDHHFATEIRWMLNSGISTGFADGTFGPSQTISREAVAAFLYRMEGSPEVSHDVEDFIDVPEDHAFHDAIMWMRDTELTTGYGDGTFRPSERITREAVAAYLYRLTGGVPAGDPGPEFSDVPADHAFHDAIMWMRDTGITTGYDGGTFGPAQSITREAVAAFLYRLDAIRWG